MVKSVLEITVPAEETDLVSLDAVKAELSIADAVSDALLLSRIEEVSALFAGKCNRINFGAATAKEIFTVFCGRTGAVWPRHWPVTEVVSVTEDGSMLADCEFRLDEERRIVRLDAGGLECAWRGRTIVATYVAGYALPNACPADLRRETLKIITASWVSRGRDPMLKSEDVPGVASMEYWVGAVGGFKDGLPEETESVLSLYRNDNWLR